MLIKGIFGMVAMLLAGWGTVAIQAAAGPVEGTPADKPLASIEQAGASELMEDELLLAGWVYLAGLADPITLWDGRVLTGHDLALLIVDQQIPVRWGGDAVCQGDSCSRLYCTSGGTCAYEDGLPGVDPIYLNDGARSEAYGQAAQVVRVAAELAHEAFHRMQPFGPVMPTQYEEFWAFYIDSQVSKNGWPAFEGVDPNDGSQLLRWFTRHNLRGYLTLKAFPAGQQRFAEEQTPPPVSEAPFDRLPARD